MTTALLIGLIVIVTIMIIAGAIGMILDSIGYHSAGEISLIVAEISGFAGIAVLIAIAIIQYL